MRGTTNIPKVLALACAFLDLSAQTPQSKLQPSSKLDSLSKLDPLKLSLPPKTSQAQTPAG